MNITKTLCIITALLVVIFSSYSCSKEDICTSQTWYLDSDKDGFGNPMDTQQSCTQPVGFVSDNTDFDDINATAFPGAPESCDDGIDNNGNGEIDECGLINQVSGSWTSNFNDPYTIDNSSITTITGDGSTSIFHILVIKNNYIICQNDMNNPFFENLFSKFVFTNISGSSFSFCQSFFNSPSQLFIENAEDPTDPNDLDIGCGGFAWGEMTRN